MLEKSGHKVQFIDIPHGGGRAIMINQNNILIGGSDPRKDGIALGFKQLPPIFSANTALSYK